MVGDMLSIPNAKIDNLVLKNSNYVLNIFGWCLDKDKDIIVKIKFRLLLVWF